MKKNNKKKLSVLAFIASILFLISYIVGKVTLNLILTFTWACIGFGYLEKNKKNKSK